MKCKDVMTSNPRTCTTAASLQAAAQIMKEEDIGIVPVVDERTRKLMGVVTDRDLAMEVAAEVKDPIATTAADVMHSTLITCKPEDDIEICEDLMKEHQLRRIPVVDDKGCCVGIIAQADIALKVGQPRDVQEVVREISKPTMRRAA
jgi:CBS-domain-containing membrane protein